MLPWHPELSRGLYVLRLILCNSISDLISVLALSLSYGRTQKASALRKCHYCGYQFIERGGSDIRGHRKIRTLRSREWESLGVDICCVSNPSPRRQRQEFEAILGYIVKLSQRKKDQGGRRERREVFQIMKINVRWMQIQTMDLERGNGGLKTSTLQQRSRRRVYCRGKRQPPGTCSLVTAAVPTISVGRCLVPDIFTG